MNKSLRSLRIRQIDETLSQFRRIESQNTPRKGWIREIREALHMTAAQLGKRISVSQPAVSQLEESEADGTITLNSLRKVARGLGGQLIYAIVPNNSLQQMLKDQIQQVARERLDRTRHTMRLEDQLVSEAASSKQYTELVDELTEKPPRNLWS